MIHKAKLLVCATCLMTLSACAPETGSDAWCEDMAKKSKADWTANEASEFAKSCIFKTYEE